MTVVFLIAALVTIFFMLLFLLGAKSDVSSLKRDADTLNNRLVEAHKKYTEFSDTIESATFLLNHNWKPEGSYHFRDAVAIRHSMWKAEDEEFPRMFDVAVERQTIMNKVQQLNIPTTPETLQVIEKVSDQYQLGSWQS